MRILMFSWRDMKNPAAGGAEVVTQEIGKRLVAKGHSMTLFAPAFPSALKTEIVDGVEIIRAGGRYSVYWQAAKYYRKYFQGKYDVIIDQINTRPFLTPKFVQKKERVVAFIHQLAREFWFYEMPFPISYVGYHWLEYSWLRNYRTIPTVTISESTKDDLVRLGFQNINIISEGLNVRALETVSDKEKLPTLMFVGRLTRAKKPRDAILAYKKVREQIPEVRMWVVGSGYLEADLRREAGPGVEFFGRVTDEKKYELMKRANLVLMPGVREGWGLVVIEANAMGTPCVGYNIHGLRDSIRDGQTGRLCEPNPKAMADAALEFLKDKKLQERWSQQSLEYARQFSWDRSADELEQFLLGL